MYERTELVRIPIWFQKRNRHLDLELYSRSGFKYPFEILVLESPKGISIIYIYIYISPPTSSCTPGVRRI
jgi:hypothetical protein